MSAWKFVSVVMVRIRSIPGGVEPQVSPTHFAGGIKIFVQEPLPQIQHYHPEMIVQHWSIQVAHLHVALVIPLKSAVSSIGGKLKATGEKEVVIRRDVDHQERRDKGHMQLQFEF